MAKTKTVCVSANLRGAAADDPLAANAPNPDYLAALAGALDLADESRVLDLARALANPERSDFVSALLCHELASCHGLAMRFGAMADQFLSHTSATVDADRRQVGRDALGFAAIAARLMARYQQGALALPKVRDAANGGVRKIIVDWGADDSPMGGSGGSSDPSPAGPADGPAGSPAGSAAASASAGRRACAPEGSATPSPESPAGASARRRGQLKNGNPSGDYLKAPRCGAKTRAGCACPQPAMKNGRCRLHGGKSTGARTAEGRRRAQTARLVHGHRTAAIIGLRSAAAAVSHRLAWMTDLARGCAPEPASTPDPTHASARRRELSAGHGVRRSDSTPPLGRDASPGGRSRAPCAAARHSGVEGRSVGFPPHFVGAGMEIASSETPCLPGTP